jgi:hypothetical protein
LRGSGTAEISLVKTIYIYCFENGRYSGGFDMKRRILAWVLLAGFVLLLMNVMFIKFYWQLSMVIYIIIAFAFLLYNSKAVRAREEKKFLDSMDDGEKDDDMNEGE